MAGRPKRRAALAAQRARGEAVPAEKPTPDDEMLLRRGTIEDAERIAGGGAVPAEKPTPDASLDRALRLSVAEALSSSSDEPIPVTEPEKPAPIKEPSPAASEAAARRKRLVGDLDPETAALFSDEELEKIEREERVRAAEDKKKQAMADVRATARQRERVEQGLIAASVLRSEAEQRRLAEPVTFRVRLPGDGAGHHGRNGFRVDGRLFQVGSTYTEPRAVFESLQSNYYRAWLNEVQFKTLDQHKPGGAAAEVLSQTMPQFEVRHG